MNKQQQRTCEQLGVCQARAECHVNCVGPAARPMPIQMEGPYRHRRAAWRGLAQLALWAGVASLAVGLLAGVVAGRL